MIRNKCDRLLREWCEQLHRLNGVSSLARDDRTNEWQRDLLLECVLGAQPIQLLRQRFSLRSVPGKRKSLRAHHESKSTVVARLSGLAADLPRHGIVPYGGFEYAAPC